MIEFIFMLTRDDKTLADARDVYASISGTGVRHVGCKDVGLPHDELKALMSDIRAKLPQDEGFGLTRDADSGDGGFEVGNDLVDGLQRPFKQLVRIVLDEPRRRSVGRHRPYSGAPVTHVRVEGNAAGARASLIDGEDHVRPHADCLSGRMRCRAVGRSSFVVRGAPIA